MAWHAGDTHLADWGDLQIGSEGLEGLQTELQSATQALVAAGHIPLVLGGGHEVAFGTGSGVLLSGRKTATLGIINIDAHLDLRVANERNSGTSFSALMDLSAAERRTVSYLCIGTALSSNTPALFSRAKSLGAEWLMDEEVLASAQAAESVVNELLSASDDLYLSIDMDAFPAHEAPGVSAPAALGVPAAILLPVIKTIVRSGRLRAVDVAELNPTFDLDNRTARLAARIIHAIIHERLT
jgi:formiminoglutamase